MNLNGGTLYGKGEGFSSLSFLVVGLDVSLNRKGQCMPILVVSKISFLVYVDIICYLQWSTTFLMDMIVNKSNKSYGLFIINYVH